MKATIFALLIVLGIAAVPVGAAEVLFTQAQYSTGGFYHSCRWDPDGSDWDQYVWDNFRLTGGGRITEIRWRGAYDPTYNGSGGLVRDFRIEFYGSAALDTQPDVANSPLKRYMVGGNAGETPIGPVGGVNMYEYSVTLTTPFTAAPNVKYWIQIEAYQWGVPDWSIARGTGGDNVHFRGVVANTLNYTFITGDTAMTLSGTPTRRPAADFDGDGKTDISIFRPAPGEWWVAKSSDGGNFATQFGTSADIPVPADLTGDAKTDIAFFRPSTGFWYVLRSDDLTFYAFPFGGSSDVPAPADFDADGKADAAVFRPSTATWYISRSAGGTTIQQFGSSADKPVPADYDGDGKADIAVYRTNGTNGAEWWISKSLGGVFATQFGTASDKAVPADFTGDSKADIAFWKPSTGEWFILRSEDLSFYAFPYGGSGDLPVPGDYDGDGRADAGVFRPSNSTWYVNRSTAGTLIQQFGQAGDQPIPNAFVR